MRRFTVAALAATEALVTVLISLAVAFAPITLLWLTHFQGNADGAGFGRTAANAWLLGHGVDLTIILPTGSSGLPALPGIEKPFLLTITVLGFALYTFITGWRIGRRSNSFQQIVVGTLAAAVVYSIAGLVLGILGATEVVHADAIQATLLPAAIIMLGSFGAWIRDGGLWRVVDSGRFTSLDVFRRWEGSRDAALIGTRIGLGSVGIVLALGAAAITVSIVARYGTIIGLSQALGAGVDASFTFLVGQLLLLPNAVIWAGSYILGPGFAIGNDTIVSPYGTLVGQLPAVPLLGIIPRDGGIGFIILALPLLATFFGAYRLTRGIWTEGRDEAWRPAIVAGVGAIVASLLLGVLAAWSGGAIGPGRLATAGPNPLLVAGAALTILGIGSFAGTYTTWLRRFVDERYR